MKKYFALVAFVMHVAALAAQTKATQDTVMLGKFSRKEIETACPWFAKSYNAYHLNDSVMQALKPLVPDLHFTLIIGTWCSDTKEHVPAFYKMTDSLFIGDDRITLFAVNRKKYRVKDKSLKIPKFTFLPTIIVYKNNKEIGRIIEDTKVSVESDILKMIRK